MKRNALLTLTAALTCGLVAAYAGPKEDVLAAAKKLAEAENYSWKSSSENTGGGGGRGFGGGPTEGKAAKDGTVLLSMARRDTTTEAVLKGGKGAVKTQDGWKSLAELEDSQGGPGGGRFFARTLQNFTAPTKQAEELAGKVKELKVDGDAIVGDLTEEGAKSLMTFGGRGGGGNGPDISGAMGKVKFWVKDGVLTKYQTKVSGTVSFNGNDRDIDRTTTVEFKDVGTTKLEVPEEAKKKLS